MMISSSLFETTPALLHLALQGALERWQQRASAEQQLRLQVWLDTNPEGASQLAHCWVASDYAANIAVEQAEDFLRWLEVGYAQRVLSAEDMRSDLAERLADVGADEALFDRQLRIFRRHMMLRILWRDFNRQCELLDTTTDMTHMAEVVLQASIRFHYGQLTERFGTPMGKASGEPQPLVVLGMGKLGGYELNVSSDIDLIFAYPESGETESLPESTHRRRSISNQEFFIKLGQKIISSLDKVTVDGFVFRVDMRLRPYGQSGALALNFGALEEYYQTQGREWERYAMIKARVVSGDRESGHCLPGAGRAGEQLLESLKPFIYRKYVDFSAIESMRAMKALINREVQRRGIDGDVKLGAGGIREIEFVVQVFQMIRGGRDVRLRERQVLKLLPLLAAEGYLPNAVAADLAAAYIFLRNTEHAIQGYQDKQTQSLPVDSTDQLRLAWLLGFDAWPAFLLQLNIHRECVRASFRAVIAAPDEHSGVEGSDQLWAALWLDELTEEELTEGLNGRGFVDSQAAARALTALKGSRALTSMQAESRRRLDALIPYLLVCLHERHQAGSLQSPADCLGRIITLIEKVARRSAYLLLLVENPKALQQLVRLCGASSWIADELCQHPALLDELLDPESLYRPPDKEALRDELRQQLLRVEPADLEGQMEALRYFRQAHGLRVAASEVTEVLPLMRVSDYLTWLAEVILEQVLELAWQQMIARHGRPQFAAGGVEPQFIVVGYGKLGGIELGHGSDLDLVFLHDAEAKYSTTGTDQHGVRSIDNQSFFMRLGQKVIHMLGAKTAAGQLYEIDMRLRPSGNSGLLVSSLKAFSKYQQEEAWTWEHQALTRTRVVAGGARLGREFEAVRQAVLVKPRDLKALKADVQAMRVKMREHLGSPVVEQSTQFHLKQDAGGIVDIEFLVQFAVLAWAEKVPSLTTFSDNIRILESLAEAEFLPVGAAQQLIDAYKTYRSQGHRLSLQRLPAVVQAGDFAAQRKCVVKIWEACLGTDGVSAV